MTTWITRHDVEIAVGLIVATLLVCAPVWRAEYVYEDRQTVQAVTASPHAPQLFARRGVTAWSYYLLGPSSSVQHGANVWLHLVNGFLVGVLARSLGLPWWIATGLFLFWPTQMQAVAYTAQRSELLSGLGILSAALALRSRVWWGVLLGAAVAIGAKESGVVVVPLLGLLLVAWRAPQMWAPVLGVASVATAMLPLAIDLNAATSATAWEWASLQAAGIWRMWVGWPLGQSIEHHIQTVPVAWQHVALVAWLWVGVGSAYALRRWPSVGLGLCWLWLALVPRLLVQTQWTLIAEHQFYTATMGLGLAIAGLLAEPAVAVRHLRRVA